MAIIGIALSPDAQTSRAIILPFDCDAGAAVGDWVYPDPANDLKVLVNSNNTVIEETIGVIYEKPTTTTANVLIMGIATGYSGLTLGGKIFLSTSGVATQVPPTSGYVQVLGVAVSDTDVLIKPSTERVKRI